MTDTVETVQSLIEESIEIAAPPAAVWALITDMPRMASWSPQVVKTIVRGGPVGLGTRTINVNRNGVLFWPTRAKVIRFEPHTEFAFRVKDNGSIWSFSLAPSGDGTLLTERREVTEQGLTQVSLMLTRHVLGGQSKFSSMLRAGIRQTLERIKADAER